MRIRVWSSDVCSSDLDRLVDAEGRIVLADGAAQRLRGSELALRDQAQLLVARYDSHPRGHEEPGRQAALAIPGWLHEQIGKRPAAAYVDTGGARCGERGGVYVWITEGRCKVKK